MSTMFAPPRETYLVAGALGFKIIWNPIAGGTSAQSSNVTSLIGLTCTMTVLNESPGSTPSTFAMTVSNDGKTASYTTASVNDFPTAGVYQVQFRAANMAGTLVLQTVAVTINVGAVI